MCFYGELDYEKTLFRFFCRIRLVHRAGRVRKISREQFSLRFIHGHAQLTKRKSKARSLIAILHFVNQKRFVWRSRLGSPSLLCFMNQWRGERIHKYALRNYFLAKLKLARSYEILAVSNTKYQILNLFLEKLVIKPLLKPLLCVIYLPLIGSIL